MEPKTLRNLCARLLLALCFAAAAAPFTHAQNAPQTPTSVALSITETREIAKQALQLGEFEIARRLAMGLLLADPKDPYAYAILAAAHASLNDPTLARAGARLSYKYSKDEQQAFASARNAARLAYSQKRYTAAQVWLRRASQYACL